MSTAAVLAALCSTASARWVWGPPTRISHAALTGLACPSKSLCVAVDAAGNATVSTHPRSRSWTARPIDGGLHLTSISCPSATLCTATDQSGDVLTSTDRARAWSLAHVDSSTSGTTPSLNGVSCPTVALCVAVDAGGNELSSTNPAGGPAAWTLTHVDNGITYECSHYYTETGPQCQPALVAVSCPTATLCATVDDSGNFATSLDPGAGTPTWTAFGAATTTWDVGLSCPSATLCAAVDGYGGDVLTGNPRLTPGSLGRSAHVDEKIDGLGAISCPSSRLCFASSWGGRLYASTAPTGSARAWKVTARESHGYVTAVACPSPAACISVDSAGRERLGKLVVKRRRR